MSSTLLQVSAVNQMTSDELKNALEKIPGEDAEFIARNIATHGVQTELKLLEAAPTENVFEEWEGISIPLRLNWNEPAADDRQRENMTIIALYPSGALRTVPCDFECSDEGVSFVLDGISLLFLCDPENDTQGPGEDGMLPPFTERATLMGIWL